MLQDGDFELAQTNAILRHLARKHGALAAIDLRIRVFRLTAVLCRSLWIICNLQQVESEIIL